MKKLYEMKHNTINLITIAAFSAGIINDLQYHKHTIIIKRHYTQPLMRWGHVLKIITKPSEDNNLFDTKIRIYSKYEDELYFNEIEDDRLEDVIEYFLGSNGIQETESMTAR